MVAYRLHCATTRLIGVSHVTTRPQNTDKNRAKKKKGEDIIDYGESRFDSG